MSERFDEERDLSMLVVPRVGAVRTTEDLWEPVRLIDAAGDVVAFRLAAFLKELQASGRSTSTQRSYAMDLLRWFRFAGAVEVPWDQATRLEARDFCRWLALKEKPARPTGRVRSASSLPNPVTGKRGLGRKYAVATRAHSETVLRVFYDFHRDAGTGPMVNPFPLSRQRRGGRPNAHHNPMEPFRNERVGLYRPRVAQRIPRCIPDEMFNRVFAELGCHRDRALVALWVSTGARASELLGARCGDVDPGQQLITVIRKGTRAIQQLPTSPDTLCGFGSTSPTSARSHRLDVMIRCGGHGVDPSDRLAITPHGRCSAGPRQHSVPTGRCTTSGTRPLIGWPAIRSCRWPMCSGCSGTLICRRRSCT